MARRLAAVSLALCGFRTWPRITFSVPKAVLGQPTAGWGFTVVLTGQDGFSPDQARSSCCRASRFRSAP